MKINTWKTPLYAHDCTQCKFLGGVLTNNERADLYFCQPQVEGAAGVLICRRSNRLNNYSCWVPDKDRLAGSTEHFVALHLATELGYIK